MLIALVWAALRRRPFSVLCTLLLVIAWASLLGVPTPAAVLGWVLATLLLLELSLVLEPFLLERIGCRQPIPSELERIAAATQRFTLTVRIADDPSPWVGGALRTVVVSRGGLHLLTEAGLYGLLG